MEYSDAHLREQLPTEDPPLEFVPPDVSDEITAWIEGVDAEDPGLIARSTRWTYAIFSELELGQYELDHWPDYPWLHYFGDVPSRASVGLFDRELERGFGIIVDVPRWPGPSFFVVGSVFFPRLRAHFPLALRQSEIELHLHHPANATSACWAQCNSSRLWGVLTAGHALRSNRPGGPVALAGGVHGTLLRSYYQPIDAAFVGVPHPPSKPAALSVRKFPAAGKRVVVECQGGSQPRTIVGTMNTMGVVRTRAFAVLFYLDQPCVHGDSGSLVRVPTGEAVGIYKARMKTKKTPKVPSGFCGVVQNFEQAIFALKVTPYL